MPISDAVQMLERDVREVFGSRLQSFLIYNAHADGTALGEDDGSHGAAHGRTHAPVRTMAVVETLTAVDLRACASRAARWHDRGLATPLLMAAHELDKSCDAFPLELAAIAADHVVVSGVDPFDGLSIDAADLRRACEAQARGHLLHLREGYVETRDRGDALAVLIVDSAPAFAALLLSVARLQGATVHDAAAAGRHAERALDMTGGVISEVAQLAHVAEISSADALRIFPAYLESVERLVAYVDGWGDR